jgi:hypothetical protein
MKKLVFVSLLLFRLSCFASDSLHTVEASSKLVNIRVGDDYFSKGAWVLDPSKKPDIFSIGSKWIYETRQVTFYTDIDSISFQTTPGNYYDFIIVLDHQFPCYTRISVMANPVFLHKKTLQTILTGLILFVCLLVIFLKKINAKVLLAFGYISALLFWVMTVTSGLIHGHYNHLKNVISELGAIGTASEKCTSILLLISAACALLFSAGFYKACRENRMSVLPAILSLAMPVTMIWTAIFTLGNELHSATGPLPLLMIAGTLLSLILWRKSKGLPTLQKMAVTSALLMLLILLRFIKPFGYEYEGLVQRFFYAGWSVWTIGICYFFRNGK